VRQRRRRVRDCSSPCCCPAQPARRVNAHRHREHHTPERFQAALAKAVELREQAVAAYEKATTRAMRVAGRELKDALK
jgi:hypothetical protein